MTTSNKKNSPYPQIMSRPMKCNRRVKKELEMLSRNTIPEISIDSTSEGNPQGIDEWIIKLKGADNTLYEGETYMLRIRFTMKYPIDSPEVQFIQPAPVHPHVYSNGHICLSILYDEWTPALTVESICLSILSMLSSCTEKRLPSDNDSYVKNAPSSSRNTKWAFHDDAV